MRLIEHHKGAEHYKDKVVITAKYISGGEFINSKSRTIYDTNLEKIDQIIDLALKHEILAGSATSFKPWRRI